LAAIKMMNSSSHSPKEDYQNHKRYESVGNKGSDTVFHRKDSRSQHHGKSKLAD
jgi:hypothetical protein